MSREAQNPVIRTGFRVFSLQISSFRPFPGPCGALRWRRIAAAAPPPAPPVARILPIPPVGPSPITPDCRFLFVVDTSSAMQRQADGLYRTTHRLIANGLGGRMQDGDIFTVWTYADTVLTREFPLNAWTPDLNIALANRAYEFLAKQKFRGKSNLRPVFAELGQALAIATNLTIVLVSDGTDVIVGTPFDRPSCATCARGALGWEPDSAGACSVGAARLPRTPTAVASCWNCALASRPSSARNLASERSIANCRPCSSTTLKFMNKCAGTVSSLKSAACT